MKLNQEPLERCLAALRSDKYVQIRDKLRDDANGRCCMGVIEETLTGTIEGDSSIGPERQYTFSSIREEAAHILGAPQAVTYGKRALLQIIMPDGNHVTPANLNDSAKFTFSQIADVLEDAQRREAFVE